MARTCKGTSGPRGHALTARVKAGKVLVCGKPEKANPDKCLPTGERACKLPRKVAGKALGDAGKRIAYGKVEYVWDSEGNPTRKPCDKSTEDLPRDSFSLPCDGGRAPIDRLNIVRRETCKAIPRQAIATCGTCATSLPACNAGDCMVKRGETLGYFGFCAPPVARVSPLALPASRVARSSWVDGDSLTLPRNKGASAPRSNALREGERIVRQGVAALDAAALAAKYPGGAPWGKASGGMGERVVDPRPHCENMSAPRRVVK
jgi:hypothetical protein